MANAITSTVPATVLPDPVVCQQARLSRDPRFDGLFFIGVVTTGIYCRTICPARIPAEDNVRYFATAASAQQSGFRPCLRCRPEAARQLPEWTLGSDTVMRALRLIDAGYLNDHSSGELAGCLDVGERQLSRLFNQELGTTPKMLARLCRARVAKSLLGQSRSTLAQVAYHSGFNSLSRFNAEIREIFGLTPGQLRKKSRAGQRANLQSHIELTLPVRLPYHFDWMFGYLQQRQLPGVEEVHGGPGSWVYRRCLGNGEWLQLQPRDGSLVAQIPLVDIPVHQLLHRLRLVFDLNADGATLDEFLSSQVQFKRWVGAAPGLRVPGAWDGFETAVRAILGQQVSVARGTTLANKMIHAYGEGQFPTPQMLLNREVAELGMPGRRGRAVVGLAQRVITGDIAIDECQDFDQLQVQLENIEGIGPWTANYIRMRVLKDPNAFPDNDWVVLKELHSTAAQARKQSQQWQPWRAYALMYLWYAAGQKRKQPPTRQVKA